MASDLLCGRFRRITSENLKKFWIKTKIGCKLSVFVNSVFVRSVFVRDVFLYCVFPRRHEGASGT